MSSAPDKLRRAARRRLGTVMILAAASVLVAAAWTRNEPAAAENDCPGRWRRHASADSSVSLCLPAGFVQREDHTWMRPSRVEGAPPVDFFSVELIQWPTDSASVGHWPPRLAPEPDCQFDCILVDSVARHSDEWDGYKAHTEVGLASGGVAGLRRRPVMVSGWVVSNERRGFAQGWAARAVTLDTLRRALRTVKMVP